MSEIRHLGGLSLEGLDVDAVLGQQPQRRVVHTLVSAMDERKEEHKTREAFKFEPSPPFDRRSLADS